LKNIIVINTPLKKTSQSNW